MTTIVVYLDYLHFKYSDIYQSMADSEKKYLLDNIDLKEAFEMFDADADGEISLQRTITISFIFIGEITLEELGKV